MLKNKVLQLIGDRKEDVGLVVKDLNDDKWILKINEDKTFQSASTIKIPIMIEMLRQIESNRYSLDQQIKIDERYKVPFSIISELTVSEYSILDLLTLMIIISDNTATNILMDLVGYYNVNILLESLNITDTKLKRKMMDFQAIDEGRSNTTTPIDMAIIMEKIYKAEILNTKHSSLAIDIMKRQLHKDTIGRYLEEDFIIANKTGELDGLNHDIGIIYYKKSIYMLGIFTENGKSNLTNKRLIGNISKAVFEYFHN